MWPMGLLFVISEIDHWLFAISEIDHWLFVISEIDHWLFVISEIDHRLIVISDTEHTLFVIHIVCNICYLLYICYKIQDFCIPDMNTCACSLSHPLYHNPFITPPFGTPLYFSYGLPRGFST